MGMPERSEFTRESHSAAGNKFYHLAEKMLVLGVAEKVCAVGVGSVPWL